MGKGTNIRGFRQPREFDPFRFDIGRRGLLRDAGDIRYPRYAVDIKVPPVLPRAPGRSFFTAGPVIAPPRNSFILSSEEREGVGSFIRDNAIPLAFMASAIYCLISGEPLFGADQAGRFPIEGLFFVLASKPSKAMKRFRKKGGRREGEDGSRQEGPPFEIRRYSTTTMQWVRMTSDCIYVGTRKRRPISIIAGARDTVLDSAKKGDAASAKWLAMMKRLEEDGDYETLAKFAIAFMGADAEAYKETKDIAELPDTGQVRQRVIALYDRLFPGAPPLPVERGIWSDLAKAIEDQKGGKIQLLELFSLITFYCTCFANKVGYGPDRVSFGPIEFTFEELFKMFVASIDEMIAVLKKRMSSPHRTRKETAENRYSLSLNLAGKKFFERGDIPAGTKIRLAVTTVLCGDDTYDNIMEEFFRAGFPDNPDTSIVIRKVDMLFDAYLKPRIEGTAKFGTTDVEVKRRRVDAPKVWRVLSGREAFDAWNTGKLNPHLSHTLFKRPAAFVRQVIKGATRDLESKRMFGDVHEQIFDALFLLDFMEERSLAARDPDMAAMLLDMIINIGEADYPGAVKILRGMISNNIRDPDRLRTKVRETYLGYFPYAAELLAKLEADRQSESEPGAAAERSLRSMSGTGEPVEVKLAWEAVRKAIPAGHFNTLVRVLSLAMASVDTSEPAYMQKYRAWIRWLGGLGRSPDDWRWLEGYADLPDGHSSLSPSRLEGMFQDLLYPVGFDGEPPREGGDPAFLRATAFLTADQWADLHGTIEQMIEETSAAVKILEERKGADSGAEIFEGRQRMVEPSNIQTALEKGLTRLLNGTFGTKIALAARLLLKEALSDTNTMYWLVVIGNLAAHGNGNDAAVGKIFENWEGLYSAGVRGDILRIAFNMESQENSTWRGAMAEYTTAMRYAKKRYFVEVLPSDMKRLRPTPDLKVTFRDERGFFYVEVKARQYILDGEAVVAGLIKAAGQLAAKTKGLACGGIIALYLIGALGNVEDAAALVKNTIHDGRRASLFKRINKVKIYFVDTLYRMWEVREKVEIKQEGGLSGRTNGE